MGLGAKRTRTGLSIAIFCLVYAFERAPFSESDGFDRGGVPLPGYLTRYSIRMVMRAFFCREVVLNDPPAEN
ncbi:MAG: hypothetical protein K2I59_01325, partial [Alistipes sp.]|nr:hypothetical protein [Alistipes sp.]